MKVLLSGLFCLFFMASAHAAIWEFDLGGNAGSGLLGGNEVDSLPDSFASGKEVGHNEISGIIYDDVEKHLEFHVGWGAHETILGTQLSGQYISSSLYGPAGMNENSTRPVYSFDSSNGYISANDSNGRTGFIHAGFKLVDLEGYTIAQQQADLLGSRWYFNIVSTTYESGEIRGQLLAVVPEPQHYALVTGVFLLVGAALKSRKKFSTSS
jgi:hypothetical protein